MRTLNHYIYETFRINQKHQPDQSAWDIETTHKFCEELCEFMLEMSDSWEDYFGDDEEAIDFFNNLQSNKNDDLVNDLLVRFIDYISFQDDDYDSFEYDINNIPDKTFKLISNVCAKIANRIATFKKVDFNEIWSKVN